MQKHHWKLFFHPCIVEQLKKLKAAADRAAATDPIGFAANANVKLFRALSHLILEIVPLDPGLDEYRQGNTMGQDYRHWRRAKIGRRFRLFFRYDSRTRVIVYALVNQERSDFGPLVPIQPFRPDIRQSLFCARSTRCGSHRGLPRRR